MTTISVLINARMQSTRLPRKLLLPFGGTTLIDIALEKVNRLDFFSHRYFAVAEDELKERITNYPNVELLERSPDAVKPGYNDHRKVFAHYKMIDSDYIFWLNSCSPLLSIDTIKKAVEFVMETKHNSYTSVIPTTDWIFDQDGNPVTNTQAGMLSTNHSRKFYKVAHAFHVINKSFFMEHFQYWTLTKNDPCLIVIPEQESFDVNTSMEFQVAEAAYRQHISPK